MICVPILWGGLRRWPTFASRFPMEAAFLFPSPQTSWHRGTVRFEEPVQILSVFDPYRSPEQLLASLPCRLCRVAIFGVLWLAS